MVAPMSAPIGAAKLVRNTIANGIGSFLRIAVALVLTPFLIHHLGLTAYGVWGLALLFTFAGYGSLADLGIETATVRYVAEAATDGDLAALNQSVSASLVIYVALALVLAPLAVAFAHVFVALFGIPIRLQDAATICFAIAGAQVAFELPARAFVAVLQGSHEFRRYQEIELGRALLQAALSVAVVLVGWGIVGLAGALSASSLSALVVYWVLAHRAVPGLCVNVFALRRADLSRVVRFGGGTFAMRLIGVIYNQMDEAIIGIGLGSRQVGLYGIASRVNMSASTIASVSVSTVVPAAASLRRDAALLRDMFIRGSCYATAVTLPFVVAAFVFARPLLISWIGWRATPAVGATRLFLLYEAIQAVQNVGSTMIYGLGRIRLQFIVVGLATLLNLGLSIALVHPLGISGVIVGTLIANGLAWPILLGYYLKTFDCSLDTWLRRVVAPNLPGLVIQVGASLLLLSTIGPNTRSLLLVIILCLVSVAISLATFALCGVRGHERRLLYDAVRRAAGQAPREA
jgi:O-antigen/teichoic acid export membrane protein